MTDVTTQEVIDTAVQTAETVLPAILSASGAAVSPAVAGIVALAPIAMQLLQNAMQLQNAGAMTADQLASLFSSIGQGIQDTHSKWATLNAPAAPAEPILPVSAI